MNNDKYLIKFYLNARHFVKLNDTNTTIHPHTWEVSLHILKSNEENQQFKKIEQLVEEFFSKYENKLINEIPPFNILTPTMENMGKIFFKEISEILKKELSFSLDTLEISENPTRIYIVNQYKTYFQDMRKEVEKDLIRFKKQHQNKEVLRKEKKVETVQQKEPVEIEEKVEEAVISKEEKNEIQNMTETPLLPSRKPKKRNVFKLIKLLTGIVAIISVAFLIYHRTLL